MRAAQLTMLKVLIHAGRVDDFTLQLMTDLKNALVADYGDKPADRKFVDDLHKQLLGVVEKQSA